jgi:hypothetical protein
MKTVLREIDSPILASHRDNVLITACGKPLELVEIGKRLIYLPPQPDQSIDVSRGEMKHLLADVQRMHIPTATGIEIAETIGDMLVQGYTLPQARSADDDFFRKRFFPVICQYQWLPDKLPASDELRRLLFDVSAGVPRMAVTAWILASRRAIRRNASGLSFEDFQHVRMHEMGPLRPAVEALLSDDPRRLQVYEDLMGAIRTPQGSFE